MTGDIQKKLASSEAAESLRMESFIASCFKSRKWPAEQGVYYTDPQTKKSREIDVISRHFIQTPKRSRKLADVLMRLFVICECKSLSGWNVLLLEGGSLPLLERFENRVTNYWSGHGEHIKETIELVSADPVYKNCDQNLLYTYYSKRSHPDDMEVAYHLQLLQPPVDLTATAFRPTKSGADDKVRSEERDVVNPFWSAIQSVLSATEAAEIRSHETARAWTDITPYHYRPTELAENLATFFDIELTRRVFFHPVIFCKARLFRMGDEIESVRSARILVRDLNFESRYVDLVQIEHAEEYIDAMLMSFEKQSRAALRKTVARLRDLSWRPGEASDELAQALGFAKK